jgi:hypothetical protein
MLKENVFELKILYLAKLSVMSEAFFKHAKRPFTNHKLFLKELSKQNKKDSRLQGSHGLQGIRDLTEICNEM